MPSQVTRVFFRGLRTGHTKAAVDEVLQNKITITDNLLENKTKKYVNIYSDKEL